MKNFIYFAFAICFSVTASAQVSFQRLYDVVQDSTHLLSDGIATNGGGFATLGSNIAIEGQAAIIHRAIFTTYDGKGEIQLAKDIYLADSTRLLGTSEIIQLDNGAFVMSANIDENDLSACVFAVDGTTAEPIWSRRIADEAQLKVSISEMEGNELVAGSTNLQEGISIWLSRINGETGEDIWAKEYVAADDDGTNAPADLFDLYVSEIDSSIILTGQSVVEGTVLGFHATKIDREGNVLWSRHVQSAPVGLNFQPLGVAEATDTSVYVTGRVVFNAGGAVINNMFISKYDQLGELVWLKVLNGESTFSNGNDIVAFGDNLVVSTQGTEDGSATISGLMEIDTSGSIINSQVYRDSMSLFSIAGGLSNTSDGGVAMFSSWFEQPLSLVSDIVKTGADLTTSCSSPTTGMLEDLPVRSESLRWSVTDFIDSDTLELDISNANYYDVPMISPSPEQWCPNELIIDTLDATPSPLPDGVITYEWMGPGVDGNTNAFVVGMEEGEYMVTVTINDRHCYTLCDTVNITRLQEPTAEINPDFSQFCLDGTVNLIGNVNGVQPFESIEWNIGSSDPIITVNEEGTYALTVLDACMETASASIDLTFPEQLNSLETQVVVGEDCENFNAILSALTNVDDDPETTYTWFFNGSEIGQSRVIEVNQTGTYTVTVNNCTESLSAEVVVEAPVDETDLRFPKVFFPRGMEEENRTFGPVNPCGLEITNYTLKIYNRWGNEVFSSENVNDEWDGMHGGSESASAVYVWVAEYDLDGVRIPEPKKGDVTLLR